MTAFKATSQLMGAVVNIKEPTFPCSECGREVRASTISYGLCPECMAGVPTCPHCGQRLP